MGLSKEQAGVPKFLTNWWSLGVPYRDGICSDKQVAVAISEFDGCSNTRMPVSSIGGRHSGSATD